MLRQFPRWHGTIRHSNYPMCRVIRATVLTTVLLGGCSSPRSQQPQSTAVPATNTSIPYPPGEYVTRDVTPCAATAVDFALVIKALDRNDIKSIKTLRDEGLAFNLLKGTRVALLPAEVNGTKLQTSVLETIDGISVCTAIVESGERIGTEVALGCNSLNSASQ